MGFPVAPGREETDYLMPIALWAPDLIGSFPGNGTNALISFVRCGKKYR
jgi:hypothetical protein